MLFSRDFTRLLSRMLLQTVLGALLFGVLSVTAHANVILPEGESFMLESVLLPREVEYFGTTNGYPRSNSGAVHFDTIFYQTSIPEESRVTISGPQTNDFYIDSGFAWNDNLGWISFMCDGGMNGTTSCNGNYETYISNVTLNGNGDYVGILAGNAWSPNMGFVDFSWQCSSQPCDFVEFNLSQGIFSGFAWTDTVGWVFMEGTFEPPILNGVCGNGQLDASFGETCDDGNLNNNDGCNSVCQLEVCGDSVLQTGEQCDDGNTLSGDGCSSTCVDEDPGSQCGNGITEPGEQCDGQPSCNPESCQENVCGDGIIYSALEQCDDGNTVSGDGCSNTCKLEPPTAVCGNGVLEPNGEDGISGNADDEQCDDGNNLTTDSCTNSCKANVCGDSFINVGVEQCDDGNTFNGDGCSSTCVDEVPGAICVNGIVEEGEQCDDGNDINGDGCNVYCEIEGFCGDGFLQSYSETCDDGNIISGDGCSSICEAEGKISCGNAIIETGEQCDDGNKNSGDGCSNTCQSEANWCGDGIIDPEFEQCDDGNTNNEDTCSNSCEFTEYSVCGDSFVTFGETCDDGNTLSGDGCSNFCQIEDGEEECENCVSVNTCEDALGLLEEMCSADIDDSLCTAYCGNGMRESSEECDDGNLYNGDGCSSTCTDEFAGSVCGNNIVEVGEQCDDGDNVSGDGCNAYCEFEESILILDDPSYEELVSILETVTNSSINADAYCSADYCGDGEWNGTEECDWSDSGDPLAPYCTFWCEIQFDGFCGDGFQDLGEECDDGNLINEDGCNTFCEYEFAPPACGDGLWSLGEECEEGSTFGSAPEGFSCVECQLVVDGAVCGDGDKQNGEACDDGNNFNGDGCSSSCETEISVENITCFPRANVYMSAFNEYEIEVDMNCLEQPTNWYVDINNFNSYNSINCDQRAENADNISGCEAVTETALSEQLFDGDSANDLLLGRVSSKAPSGYSCLADPENLYALNSVNVRVIDGSYGYLLYSDTVPVNYNMNFDPHVAPYDFSHNGNYFLDMVFGRNNPFLAMVDILSPVRMYGAIFNLDVAGPHDFAFDVDKDNVVDYPPTSPDSDEHEMASNNLPGPNYSGTGLKTIGNLNHFGNGNVIPNPFITNPFGYAIGTISDELAEMIITYTTPSGDDIYYCADRLPDVNDLRQFEYEAQVIGPVSSDKLLGDLSYTQVSDVGGGYARRDIVRNISRIVKTSDLSATGTVNLNFNLNNIVGGEGSLLTYNVSGTNIMYFKDDVVISGQGVLENDENRTIVVQSGNVYIDSPLVSSDGTFLEIVVLDGNVYIGPNVTRLEAHMFIDGSLFPYDGESRGDYVPNWQQLLREGKLDNQFILEGSVTSENTIGGSSPDDPNSPYYKGDGSIAMLPENSYIYDLDRFRRHGLIPGQTDNAGNPLDCDNDGVLEIGPDFEAVKDDNICGEGAASETSDMIPSGLRYAGTAPDQNYGVYFIYSPPSNNSVIFNRALDTNVE